eukprot:4318856-Alexandrium_andersonii.AAC.1
MRAVPWAWQAGSEPSDGGPPQVIPHVAQDVPAPPPRARAAPSPRRVSITRAMLEEHGYTADCLKCSR